MADLRTITVLSFHCVVLFILAAQTALGASEHNSDAPEISDTCLSEPSPPNCCTVDQTQVEGGPGQDIFFPLGDPTGQCVFSYAARDFVHTGQGDDFVAAGSENDFVSAGAGNDAVLGGGGADFLNGKNGDDTLYGGDENDWILAGKGADHVFGGKGDDIILAGRGGDWIVPGPGRDLVFAGVGDDTVAVHDACELVAGEHLRAGPGKDRFILPIPLAEVEALGVTVAGFEEIVIAQGSCQSECVPKPDCSGHGVCAEGENAGEVMCSCDTGWAGEHCEWCIGATNFICPSFDADVTTSVNGTESAFTMLAPASSITGPSPVAAPPQLTQAVLDAIAVSDPSDLIAVVFSIRAQSHVPSFPRLRVDLDPQAQENVALMQLRQSLAQNFAVARATEMQWLVDTIVGAGGVVAETQALGAVVIADVPAGTLQGLLADNRLRSIATTDESFEPPSVDMSACGNIASVIGCGSEDEESPGDECTPVSITQHSVALNLHRLRTAGFGGQGYVVGNLDTGVAPHIMLEDRIVAAHNCVIGGMNPCPEEPFVDVSAAGGTGHGTATASIIAGNFELGPQDRGITQALVESWRVYDTDFTKVPIAGPRAITEAVNAGNQVLLLEVQTIGGGSLNMEAPAEEAFDAGAVVIAVTGNAHDFAPCELEMGPLAKIPNVITVGAYGIFNGANAHFARQQVGDVAGDGYIKPDLQMPSFAKGASTECNNCLDENGFSSSSGAGPFAASMGVMLLDRIAEFSPPKTPARDLAGIVHAAMIAFGTHEIAQVNNDVLNLQGSGRTLLRSPECSRWKFGKVSVPAGQTSEIDIPATVLGVDGARAAIWWPEAAGAAHVRFGLTLEDESNSLARTSQHPTSVFQNIVWDDAQGTKWRLLIINQSGEEKEVYYFFQHGFPESACTLG